MNGKHLKRKREQFELTQDELSKRIFVTRKTINSYENGGSIPESKALLLENFFKELENKTDGNSYTTRRRNLKNRDKEHELTYYEAGANASLQGGGEILPVEKTSGTLVVSDLFKGSQYALRVAGNSMMPTYPPGAIIGITYVDGSYINPGTVYVVESKSGELWIKRLYYFEDNIGSGNFELVSDNSMIAEHGARKGKLNYPPFQLPFDEVRAIFRVTGIFKSNILTVINGN